MLTEKGEYSTQAEINNDKDATVKRVSPTTRWLWTAWQMSFAEQMNALNQAQGVTGAGNLFMNRIIQVIRSPPVTLPSQSDWAEVRCTAPSTDPNAPLRRPLQPGQIPRGILQRAPD